MNVFPYTLIRIANGNIKELEKLVFSDTCTSVSHKMFRLEKDLKQEKENVSERLFQLIKENESSPHIKLLLNLKRDIFNGRFLKVEKSFLQVNECFPEIKDELTALVNLYRDHEDTISLLHEYYNKELIEIRENFQRLIQNDDFKKGLVLSSPTLLIQMEQYLKIAPIKMKKKEFQTERGLLRYFFRMYTKTSPFSIFTQLAASSMSAAENDKWQFHYTNKKEIKSHVKLNNELFKYLQNLLYKCPEIYRLLPLKLNPSLSENGGQLRFFLTIQNVDVFQETEKDAILDQLLSLLSEKECTIFSLTQLLLEQLDEQAEDIEAYLLKLVDYGLIEFDLKVSGIDPDWDIKLTTVLSEERFTKCPLVPHLLHVLEGMRTSCFRYEEGDSKEREKIKNESFRNFRDICLLLHTHSDLPQEEQLSFHDSSAYYKKYLKDKDEEIDFGSFHKQVVTYFYLKPEKIFYEDTTLEVSSVSSGIRPIADQLENFFSYLSFFDLYLEERIKMYTFYHNYYGDTPEINLLDYYEHYTKEHKKRERLYYSLRGKKESIDRPPLLDDPALKEALDIRSEQSRLLEQSIDELASVQGDSLQIKAFSSPKNTNVRTGSFGAFVQFYKNEHNDLHAVLNTAFLGFGKLSSRFLHCLPPDVKNTLIKFNTAFSDAFILAENCDASVFNANMHPVLMPFEISMPGSQNSLNKEQQIPVNQLCVRKDKANKKLTLHHKPSGKEVAVFDLGFQSLKGRSDLFQLLGVFNFSEINYALPFIEMLDKKFSSETDGIRMTPRMVYDGTIILQRKRWIIPFSHIPKMNEQMREAEYYSYLLKWKITLGLPDEVFVRIKSSKEEITEREQKLRRDDYKPFYMNFNNPLLVGLFEKIIQKTLDSLIIEEMLPDSRQAVLLDEHPHATEFLLQWYQFPQN